MRRALLVLLVVGCGELPPEGDPAGPGAAEPAHTEDASQILSPLPAWRGWRMYAGVDVTGGAFASAVEWWRTQGHDFGTDGGDAIRVVDLRDRPGPDGKWALVHYRGDEGADVRLFEGARLASAEQLAVLLRHELGHVIGLQHSRDPRCLMWEGGLNDGSLCSHETRLLHGTTSTFPVTTSPQSK